ncbi:hypothetical protein MNBD_ALPHA01-798, partial [hydrothermal vent metagenome]
NTCPVNSATNDQQVIIRHFVYVRN